MLNRLFQFVRSSNLGAKIKRLARRSPVISFFYKLSIQRLIDYRYPRTFNLEPTNACNLTCQMCPRDKSSRKIGFMDMELLKRILDEAKTFGPRHFVLHKDGEPLLHPHIVEIVSAIKLAHPGNTAYISTNGLVLDNRKSEELIKTNLDQLHISIGAATPETYSRIRGTDLNQVEENVRQFLALREKLASKSRSNKKPVVTLQIIKMAETLEEIPLFVKKWSSYPVNLSIPDFLTWGGAEDNPMLKNQQTQKRYPCHSLWVAPSINWDGRVSICCIDWNNEEIIGDVKTQSLSEIWQSDKLKQYRQYHLTGQYDKIPLCRNCNYWQETPNFFFGWQYK